MIFQAWRSRQFSGNKEIDTEGAIRYTLLKNILHHKRRFSHQYGEIVICVDHYHSWRKEVFPYYKAQRKENRDKTVDWKLVFNTISKVADELKTHFGYRVIRVHGAEADDIIATLCHHKFGTGEPIMIVSEDKDFLQLQKYKNVKQYSMRKSTILTQENPLQFILEHIIRGDASDGIPNVLSEDDAIVDSTKRQKRVMSKKVEEWVKMTRDDLKKEFRR